MSVQGATFASLRNIEKTFGAVRALAGADLEVRAGQVTAVVGHNGAGKSTLMQVMAGAVSADSGSLRIGDRDVCSIYDVRLAHALGVRCVFQELSLSPSLTTVENTLVSHRELRGFGSRRRARRLMEETLAEIYPGHQVDLDTPIGALPISQRQMVETARAFAQAAHIVKLIILDEATSSLDANAARQLLSFMRSFAERGAAILFISHRLDEILIATDRISVMKDGRSIGEGPTSEFSELRLVEMMGIVRTDVENDERFRAVSAVAVRRVKVEDNDASVEVSNGEVVGLAGLAGQGQRDFLLKVFSASCKRIRGVEVTGTVAYVSGDRQVEGIFALWSVCLNTMIGAERRTSRGGVINLSLEKSVAESWRRRLSIRAPNVDHGIVKLSGGNQQKVLVARAFAREANVVLLDDPLRGVDVATKQELYGQIRSAAAAGQTFIWYTTELAELANCDRIYVFFQGSISDVIPIAEFTEQRVIRSSFRSQNRFAPQ
jgi:ribose transport system ATP-binding protein